METCDQEEQARLLRLRSKLLQLGLKSHRGVTDACLHFDISRKTFYKWKKRFEEPFRIHVIQTDNGAEFQSKFHRRLGQLDIRHVYIRPRTPRLNGKVERWHRADDQEFYQLLDKNGISDDIRLYNPEASRVGEPLPLPPSS